MAVPTGKLKYAYQTISNMEAIINKKQETINKVIATQKKYYGDCVGLHLAMITLIKEIQDE